MTALDPNHPAFDSYRRRMRGEKLPLAESQPEAGFYRYRTRTINTAAIIMPNRNESPWDLVCFVGPERRVMEPVEIWSYVAGRHVSPDAAKVVLETGEWPASAPAAPALNEFPKLEDAGPKSADSPAETEEAQKGEAGPEPQTGTLAHELNNAIAAGIDKLLVDAEAYLETASQFFSDLKGKIETEIVAKKAASYREELWALALRVETKRVSEKEPFLQKGREIDALYGAPRDRLKELHAAIGRPLKAYLDAEQAKLRAAAEAERKRLEAEAEQRRQQAIEAAKACQDEEAAQKIAEIPIESIMEKPAPVVEKARIESPRSGKKVGLKKETTYVIEDYDAVLEAVKNQTDVREAVQKAVNRLMRAGVAIPGAKKVEGTRI